MQMLPAEREQLPGNWGLAKLASRPASAPGGANRSPPAPTCCQVAGNPGKYLTSIKHQHATFDAGSGTLLGLRAIDSCSVGENPSRACLVLPGALRICLARYFTTPSRLGGVSAGAGATDCQEGQRNGCGIRGASPRSAHQGRPTRTFAGN